MGGSKLQPKIGTNVKFGRFHIILSTLDVVESTLTQLDFRFGVG